MVVAGAQLTIRVVGKTTFTDEFYQIKGFTVTTPTPTASPVMPPPTSGFQSVLINCGGGQYTDTQGRVWQADTFNQGGVYSNTKDDILDTADDAVRSSHIIEDYCLV
jgi:hypothetical protein